VGFALPGGIRTIRASRAIGCPGDVADAGRPRSAILKPEPPSGCSARAGRCRTGLVYLGHVCEGHVGEPDEARPRAVTAAAEVGHLEAQRILAWNYLDGRGGPKDTAAAALSFRKAAEQGDAGPQFQLAATYCTGAGVVRNLGGSGQMVPGAPRPTRRIAMNNHAAKGLGPRLKTPQSFPVVLRGGRAGPRRSTGFTWATPIEPAAVWAKIPQSPAPGTRRRPSKATPIGRNNRKFSSMTSTGTPTQLRKVRPYDYLRRVRYRIILACPVPGSNS
jgi:hypothetical protein